MADRMTGLVEALWWIADAIEDAHFHQHRNINGKPVCPDHMTDATKMEHDHVAQLMDIASDLKGIYPTG